MKCFYHNDADGMCSGFWVALSVGLANPEQETTFIEMDYNKQFPMDSILPDEQIYIVDFSIQPNEMKQLLTITKDVTWIDHHKTAIAKYADFPYDIRGLRYDGIAACMLTYCYIHHMTDRGMGDSKPFDIKMTYEAPYFTRLIADWDVWRFEYGNDTRHFITAFNSYDFNPQSDMWNIFLERWEENGGEYDLIREGKTMIKFRDGWAADVCKSKGFEVMFEGHKAYALNLPNCNSEYFDSINDGSYDILIPFSYNGEKWTYSLYSKTVDVSELAKKYGGGGHASASGFVSDSLLLKKNSGC